MISNDEAKARIGANVSRVMDEKRMTQAELSRITDENEVTISRVVRGTNVPNCALLHRIAEALQVSIDSLLAPPRQPHPVRKLRSA